MKNTIVATTLVLGSIFGIMNVAHASEVHTDKNQSSVTTNSSAPSGYEKYGIGEVKADGQWVNDN